MINLIGKILMVLITVMSLLFMSFAVAIYMTHEDWRGAVLRPATEVGPGKPLGLRSQLEQENAKNEQLTAELDSFKKQVQIETADREQRLAKLEHARVERAQELVKAKLETATSEMTLSL